MDIFSTHSTMTTKASPKIFFYSFSVSLKYQIVKNESVPESESLHQHLRIFSTFCPLPPFLLLKDRAGHALKHTSSTILFIAGYAIL